MLTCPAILGALGSALYVVLFVVESLVVLRSRLLVALVLILPPSLLLLCGLVTHHCVAVGVLVHLQELAGKVFVV